MSKKKRARRKYFTMSTEVSEAVSKNSLKRKWQRVKIKGNIVSDDGGGLEGLIGLEVLEKYDNNLVATERKSKKRQWKERRDEKRRKVNNSTDNKNACDDSESEAEIVVTDEKKPKKVKNAKKKEKSKLGKELIVNEHPRSDEEPSDNESECKKPKQMKVQKNTFPGQFVLLKPPVLDENDEHIQSNNTANNLTIDDLEGWNGLGVPSTILQAIAENGFKSPTQIQSLTLPAAIMGKKDILGAAETGSGKTLAFGIPLLSGIMELKARQSAHGIRKAPSIKTTPKNKEDRDLTPPPEELQEYPDMDFSEDEEEDGSDKPLYALILTPTRELALQVKDHIVSAAKYTGIKVAAIFGGMAIVKQERVLRRYPEIVVATPGRLWELICQGNSHLNKIDNISFLVIDETDRMVEKGHFEELRHVLKRINADENKKQTRQNFVFSATLTLVHDIPDHLQKKNFGKKLKMVKPTPGMKIQSLIDELGISQPKIVDITSSQQTATSLTECRLICPLDQKDFFLYYFVQMHPGRTIVFCNSIDCVRRLSQLFSLLDCQPLPLHANMIQKQRLKNLERFRDNPKGFLIATDVAARGLDIQNVEHVIHYQVPRTSENYVHRSGRTARANKDGITVMIMEPGEVKNYLKLCKTLDRSEDLPIFPVSEKYLNAVKERVNLAREVDILELKLRRELSDEGWLKRNAMEMDIVIGDDDDDDGKLSDDDEVSIEKSKQKRLLTQRRQQLKDLLSKPIFPKGFSYKYPTSSGQFVNPFFQSEGNSSNSAVRVMKDAIEDNKNMKKQKNKKNGHISKIVK